MRFRLDVFAIVSEHSFIRRLPLPLVGGTLHFHLHPIAGYLLHLLFGFVWTFAARFLDGRLSMSMAGPLPALEDEAPLVSLMFCLIVTSSSPIRQNFSGGIPFF